MSMKNFLDGLEKRAEGKPLFEATDAYEVVQAGGKKDWYYVPKQDFLNGILRVAVHEVSDDKWEIIYCAPGSTASDKAKKGGKNLMANKEIEDFVNMLNEEVEGSPNTIKGWTVKTKWDGSFEECLNKCIDLVQGKTSSIPAAFKTK